MHTQKEAIQSQSHGLLAKGEWGKVAMLECLVYNRGLAVLEVRAVIGVLGGLPTATREQASSEPYYHRRKECNCSGSLAILAYTYSHFDGDIPGDNTNG